MKDPLKRARADHVGYRVTVNLPRGGRAEGVIVKVETEEGRGTVATLHSGHSVGLADIVTRESLPGAYVSTYCNFAHAMKDGKPINHECRVLPPAVLRLERNDLIPAAIAILQGEEK